MQRAGFLHRPVLMALQPPSAVVVREHGVVAGPAGGERREELPAFIRQDCVSDLAALADTNRQGPQSALKSLTVIPASSP